MNRRSDVPPPSAMTTEWGSDERELIFTRRFRVSRERLFDAWTRPAQLAKWWGPRGFTIPVCKTDLRPGGAYRIVMRSPDGVEYPLKGIYQEIVRPERLMMTADLMEHPDAWHALLDEYRRDETGNRAPELLWTVLFDEQQGETTLRLLTRFDTVTDRDALLKMGMVEGWSQSLDRLEEWFSTE